MYFICFQIYFLENKIFVKMFESNTNIKKKFESYSSLPLLLE